MAGSPLRNFDIPMEAVQRNVDHLGINYNELPQLPFWAAFTGRSQQDVKLRIAARIMMDSAIIRRELTQPEKDALSYYTARVFVTKAWDLPFAVASTVVLYRGTHAKYGFPFWTPKADNFNPNKFPLLPKQFEGEVAQKLWHGLRLAAWYSGCKVVTGIFFLSYSASTYIAATNSDPRLKDYNEAIRARLNQKQRPGAPKPGQQTRPAWDSAEQSTQDSQSAWPEMQSSQPERARDTFRNDESYVFDDASPVAPTEQQKAASQQATQSSAWDRIRSEARAGGAAQVQGSAGQASSWERKRDDELTSEGAREGSSFSFSSGDEEKSYAKEQAQRDFDEMLERERRGEASGRR